MSAAGKPGPLPSSEAELDRLAAEVDMDGLDESDADDADLAEFASLATELLEESGAGAAPARAPAPAPAPAAPAPASNGTGAAAAAAAGVNGARLRAESALGSLMSRARTSGFAGLRFGAGAAGAGGGAAGGGVARGLRDPFDVLGVRDAARWRAALARDAARPPHSRPLSRSYRGARGAVRRLDERAACALAADAMRAATKDARVPADQVPALLELAARLGPAFLPEVERAIASRVTADPDFDPARFPHAAARFCA